MPRLPDLEQDYEAAWQEWEASGDQVAWPVTQATGSPVLRGEIRLIDLDPLRGSEANKRRPAVIVSNDRANSIATRLGRGVVTVMPATSNIDRVFPFQALLPAGSTGLPQASKARAEQVRSIAVERLGAVLRHAPADVWGSSTTPCACICSCSDTDVP